MVAKKKKARKRTCPTCGKIMDIYYGEWCPLCDKPEVYTVDTLNFIKVKHHLEAIGREDLVQLLNEWMQDCAGGNDTSADYYYDRNEEDELGAALWEIFELGDRQTISFYISW